MANISAMAREAGLPARTVRARLERGWTLAEAFSTPIGTRVKIGNLITHNGRSQTIANWAKEIGIDASTLSRRLAKLTPEEAITAKPNTRFEQRAHKAKMLKRLDAIAASAPRKPIDTRAEARQRLEALYAMREQA